MKPEEIFDQICKKFTDNYPDVKKGEMMSAPGLKYRNKIFTFFHNNAMCFRVGAKFDLWSFGITNPKPLTPFKTKPPLKGWYYIENNESKFWDDLNEEAMKFTQLLFHSD